MRIGRGRRRPPRRKSARSVLLLAAERVAVIGVRHSFADPTRHLVTVTAPRVTRVRPSVGPWGASGERRGTADAGGQATPEYVGLGPPARGAPRGPARPRRAGAPRRRARPRGRLEARLRGQARRRGGGGQARGRGQRSASRRRYGAELAALHRRAPADRSRSRTATSPRCRSTSATAGSAAARTRSGTAPSSTPRRACEPTAFVHVVDCRDPRRPPPRLRLLGRAGRQCLPPVLALLPRQLDPRPTGAGASTRTTGRATRCGSARTAARWRGRAPTTATTAATAASPASAATRAGARGRLGHGARSAPRRRRQPRGHVAGGRRRQPPHRAASKLRADPARADRRGGRRAAVRGLAAVGEGRLAGSRGARDLSAGRLVAGARPG